MAAGEVGLWKLGDSPNFADTQAGCNKYSSMIIG